MTISFSRLGRHGRLGNQLFQIMSTIGLAEKHGTGAVFPDWKYDKYFEQPIPHAGLNNPRVLKEQQFNHHEWPVAGDCDILGYLQSEKYFGHSRLKFNPGLLERLKRENHTLFEKETICVHIRRGDYVNNAAYVQLTPNYYISALLDNFPNWKECTLLFISDEIEYARTHYE